MPLVCRGLRPVVNGGGSAKSCPSGRHIQLTPAPWLGAGLGDRTGILNWLMDLGHFNNATVHIEGGWHGADHWLERHSLVVNREWSHYLKVPDGCGQFKEREAVKGCRHITDRHFNFSSPLFDDSADGCVVVETPYYYDHLGAVPASNCHVMASDQARTHGRQALAEKGLPERFGAVHVRRCDRGQLECNSPASVAFAMCHVTEVDSWVVFYYTERGYRDQLAKALASSCNPAVVFEDDMDLNPFHDGDNFYAYQVANVIISMSSARVEAKMCSPSKYPPVSKGNLDESFGSDYNETCHAGVER